MYRETGREEPKVNDPFPPSVSRETLDRKKEEDGRMDMEMEKNRERERRGEIERRRVEKGTTSRVIIAAHRFLWSPRCQTRLSRFANSTRRRTSNTLARLQIELIRVGAEC